MAVWEHHLSGKLLCLCVSSVVVGAKNIVVLVDVVVMVVEGIDMAMRRALLYQG